MKVIIKLLFCKICHLLRSLWDLKPFQSCFQCNDNLFCFLAFLELPHLVCGEIVGNSKLPVIKKEFFVWDYFSYLTFDLNCLLYNWYFEISFTELINSWLLHIIIFTRSFHFFENHDDIDFEQCKKLVKFRNWCVIHTKQI